MSLLGGVYMRDGRELVQREHIHVAAQFWMEVKSACIECYYLCNTMDYGVCYLWCKRIG